MFIHPCRRVIVPKEKREELVATLDDLIKRLRKIINSRKTKMTVRVRAMQVLTELIRTSYTMVRDVEVEELERETETLEEEEKRPKKEDTPRKEPTQPA
jgi:polyhydroxyalkanoate synthesis regulator phasin